VTVILSATMAVILSTMTMILSTMTVILSTMTMILSTMTVILSTMTMILSTMTVILSSMSMIIPTVTMIFTSMIITVVVAVVMIFTAMAVVVVLTTVVVVISTFTTTFDSLYSTGPSFATMPMIVVMMMVRWAPEVLIGGFVALIVGPGAREMRVVGRLVTPFLDCGVGCRRRTDLSEQQEGRNQEQSFVEHSKNWLVEEVDEEFEL
jgi:hypothetical protein